MGHLYRHKVNRMLYVIEHLILDIKHLNRNGFSGIYAKPYGKSGETIVHIKSEEGSEFDPLKFVDDNFEIVCKI